MTQELLRRLTRSGTMYLIPADIGNKYIIRFTVTSQFTTAEDILRDWSTISKTAATLLAERRTLAEAEQPKPSGTDGVLVEESEENQDLILAGGGNKSEETLLTQDKAEVELWIDKVWNEPRKQMRSLSCSAETLPCTYIQQIARLGDAAVSIVVGPSEAGPHHDTESAEPSSIPQGKQVLKKLTKFYSMPIFCNPWLQCARHQMCCPVRVALTGQTQPLTSACSRTNMQPSLPVANTAPTPTPLENGTE